MTFTIDQVYKAGVPRGQYYRSAVVNLATNQTVGLTVSPTTSPENWALLVEKLVVVDNSVSKTTTDYGLLELAYPDYVGINQVTYEFDTPAELMNFVDDVKEFNSETQYTINFHPPILLKGSNSETDLTVGLPTGQTIASGDISFLVTGWQIKESDYD